MNKTRVALALVAVGLLAWAQNDGPGAGQGYMPEFSHSSRQILQLAEATPPENFAWRPAPGVRSISEVYMHVAMGNYFLLTQAGVELENAPKFTQTTEKDVKDKAAVDRLAEGLFRCRQPTYPKAPLKNPPSSSARTPMWRISIRASWSTITSTWASRSRMPE